MAQMPEVSNGNGGIIKVGTTGTIGSLMTRELESMKHMPQASDSSHKKPQTAPVSVPCGAMPKKPQPRRNTANESGSSSGSSNGNNTNHKNAGGAQKPRYTPRKSGHRVPITSDNINIDRNSNREKPEKKGSSHLVQVVDLKCSNPMSSRLKKFGFSKLSESVI